MAGDSEYVLEMFRAGVDFTLYRGTERGNQMPIFMLAVTAERPLPQSLRRLEHEYSLASELGATWATQPLALSRYQGRAVLILKDPGGEPLDQIIAQNKGQPIDLIRVLRIAIGLSAALDQTHQQRLIHKDVKPANALVDDAGHVWLTGFGIASRLSRERQAPAVPEMIAGTLAYMSPEQTGRMNRSMDARSDLYSLGVTLYEMLTGALPFAAADPLEWVHCHIALRPASPADRGSVPEALSAITMRLLAKNAEERYQTATGLAADLRRCLSEWQSNGRIDPFPLGADDSSDRLLIPEKLYGREREVEVLLATFDRVVAQGSAELVLVSGYSGVGKSSVVNELHKVLVPPRGFFAAGKFDQYKRDVPYATLAQAFQLLVRQILVKSETDVNHWRDQFLEALGRNGQLIVHLIPELEIIIGKQPAVAELPPQEARGRFQLVFRRFLGVFARPEHPLALFLDDLQWLDTATLELLERLVTDSDVRHVLLVGAYRDNEVSSSHPLMRTLAAIGQAGAKVQEIVLAPLGLDDIGRLIADALHCEPISASPLALLVHEKTDGNPFFAIQLLTTLVEEDLLLFDRGAAAWIWDLNRIRAKGYSGSVVDLMMGKLQRLSGETQTALQQFACLGNVAEAATLGWVSGRSEDEIHTAHLEAVRAGLIARLGGSYAFLHDRIQEAAYALIPESARAEAHLGIGRMLLASLAAGDLAEHLFEVANQLNRAGDLLTDHNEKRHVAEIDLRAGRTAKASTAYASALTYFVAGMALLDDRDWIGQYDLTFGLWVERAECELLCGNLEKAAQLLADLLPRAASKVDEAAVYCLKIQLQILRSEHEQAVADSLDWLRGFGTELSAHPTADQVRAEYDSVWLALDGRPIESLIDLPLLTDPEMQAISRVFSVLIIPATLIDYNLACTLICRMVAISLQHGMSGASTSAYSMWWFGPGSVFRGYDEAYRLAKLACELVEKHGFIANQMLVYAGTAAVAIWMQSTSIAIEYIEKAIRAAIDAGDVVSACFNMVVSVTFRLLRSDPLDVVLREAELALAFTQKSQVSSFAALIKSQQRFIATMRVGAASHTVPGVEAFDETSFEAQLAEQQMPMFVCMYWILKVEARFRSGDIVEALAAAETAKPLLHALAGHINVLDYTFYTALAVSAAYETGSADEQTAWRRLLGDYQEQLRHWAENYPPTFADRLALVSAEIARTEKRDADALRLYEEAIHLARENGFVKIEGLAHELAAQYYLARGIETAGYAYLRNSRNCYERWGAHGKVKQLDEHYPRLRQEQSSASSVTIGSSLAQLDVETVVKASQALSGEIVPAKLIEKLVRIAVENAGAERGLLILIRRGEPRIEAEATTSQGRIEVVFPQTAVGPSELSQFVLHYTIRTQERVLLDNASADNFYSNDEYVRRKRAKSVLCLPIVKQAKLIGALYLENNLTACAFTPERVTVLQLLASQAAISLENAGLYSDLQRSEDFLAQGQRISQTGSYGWNITTGEVYWSEEFWNILEWDRAAGPMFDAMFQRVHPGDRDLFRQALDQAKKKKTDLDLEVRFTMPDGRVKHVHIMGRAPQTPSGNLDFVGAVRDITDRTRAEEALRQALDELVRINRVTTMGELSASLAHELSQPISGVMTNANTCLRKLARDKPDLDELRSVISRTARDAQRATDIIGRIRSQFVRGDLNRQAIDVNEINRETVALLRDDAARYHISFRAELATDLPQVFGDRVQLQQVAMNLIINSIEAMKHVEGIREVFIKSQLAENQQILVSVSDTGVGFAPQVAKQMFDPFYTTKPHGTGMGLRISRSIIESHSGRLWAVGSPGHGATFHWSLPAAPTRAKTSIGCHQS
jgi:predicted ATPase/signal transduction histidine kinase/GAF domain-containing protein